MRFYLCIFESDTVKSDCPVQFFLKMMKYVKISYRMLVNFTSFTVFSGNIKKKNLKMTSQLVIFRAFLSPTLNLNFFPVNQLIKDSSLGNEIKFGEIAVL